MAFLDVAVVPADLSCASRRFRRPRLARQSPRRVPLSARTSRRRTLTDSAAVKVVSGWFIPMVGGRASRLAHTGGFVDLT
ncbi:MAG: hypothetical protein ABI355_00355 [Solirubrobacteraceae bacterium]